jgi:hypothetical protein
VLEYLDGRDYRVVQEFDFASEVAEWIIRVPAGFITDFASVPRFFWRVLPPTGQYGKAAVIHDYLYRTHGASKALADQVFLEASTVLGVPVWKRHAMYYAVKLFGGRAYRHGSVD